MANVESFDMRGGLFAAAARLIWLSVLLIPLAAIPSGATNEGGVRLAGAPGATADWILDRPADIRADTLKFAGGGSATGLCFIRLGAATEPSCVLAPESFHARGLEPLTTGAQHLQPGRYAVVLVAAAEAKVSLNLRPPVTGRLRPSRVIAAGAVANDLSTSDVPYGETGQQVPMTTRTFVLQGTTVISTSPVGADRLVACIAPASATPCTQSDPLAMSLNTHTAAGENTFFQYGSNPIGGDRAAQEYEAVQAADAVSYAVGYLFYLRIPDGWH
jgi:hypothetical protein